MKKCHNLMKTFFVNKYFFEFRRYRFTLFSWLIQVNESVALLLDNSKVSIIDHKDLIFIHFTLLCGSYFLWTKFDWKFTYYKWTFLYFLIYIIFRFLGNIFDPNSNQQSHSNFFVTLVVVLLNTSFQTYKKYF